MTHTQLVRLMAGRLERLLGVGLVWVVNTGAASRLDTGTEIPTPGRPMHFGRVGQADISGLLPPSGRRLEVECKTGDAVLSKAQKVFRADVIRGGGVFLEARDTNWLQVLGEVEQLLGAK